MAPIFLLIWAVGACAHPGPSSSELRRLVDAELASQPMCLRLPTGAFAYANSAGVTIEGARLTNGLGRYPDAIGSNEDSIRRTYDLLVELGLFTVVERQPSSSPRLVRHYGPTDLGRTHYRAVRPTHGSPDWYALCYGTRVMVGPAEIGPTNRPSACEMTSAVGYGYRYARLPAWVDDPRLRAIFPEIVTSSDAELIRRGTTVLTRRGHGWFVEHGDPLARVVCIED